MLSCEAQAKYVAHGIECSLYAPSFPLNLDAVKSVQLQSFVFEGTIRQALLGVSSAGTSGNFEALVRQSRHYIEALCWSTVRL
jgi:hypothetical protein